MDDKGRIVREVRVASEPEALFAVLKNPAYQADWVGSWAAVAMAFASGLTAPSSDGPGRSWLGENRARSNVMGEHSSSTQWWKDVPHGTMDEVSSHFRLNLPLTARPRLRLFHLVFESHGRALVPIPKRSTSP